MDRVPAARIADLIVEIVGPVVLIPIAAGIAERLVIARDAGARGAKGDDGDSRIVIYRVVVETGNAQAGSRVLKVVLGPIVQVVREELVDAQMKVVD
jgi:hypothetical protein